MRNEKTTPSSEAIKALKNGPELIAWHQEKFLEAIKKYNESIEKDKKLQKQNLIFCLKNLLEKIKTLCEKIVTPPFFEQEEMRWRFIENSATLYQDSLKIVFEDISKNLTPSLISKEICNLYDACEKKLTDADRFIRTELALIRKFIPAEIEAKTGSRFTDYVEPAGSSVKKSTNPQTFFSKIKTFFTKEKSSSTCLGPKN